VNGLEEQLEGQIEVINLNLLSPVGRRAALAHGVRMVPLVLLFDGRGEIVLRQAGMPDANRLLRGYRSIQAPA
jgi:hypothetical protein